MMCHGSGRGGGGGGDGGGLFKRMASETHETQYWSHPKLHFYI